MRHVSRRTMLVGAGVGLGALADGARRPLLAQADRASASPMWSAEYTAKKGDVSLALYRKRIGVPKAGERPRPVLFLVHGSSVSAKPSFDLTVPGNGEYSLMNVFAGYGFDVWTMDHEGYGKSTRTGGNSDIASGVADLKAARLSRGRPGSRVSTSTAAPPGHCAGRASPWRGRSTSTGWSSRRSPGRGRARPHWGSGPSSSSTTALTTGAHAVAT